MGAVRVNPLPLLAGLVLLTACSGGGGTPAAAPSPVAQSPASSAPVTTSSAPVPTTSSSTPPPPSSSSEPAVTGKVVVLDPGHNGGNASHPKDINRSVPAGRGQMKPCNTTGTATNAGYSEHAFNFAVAQEVGAALAAKGIKVVYTRTNDTGVGPCVDRRAEIGNDANADAVVSIHADGSTSAGAHGFHVAYSSPPLNAAQGAPSTKLARTVRDGLRADGFTTSTYIGSAGLSARSDLGGLNLSTRPTVLVECGNMRNSAEAALMSSAAGRAKYAAAIASAIEAYLS
ncbi:N-acetylmuramoyl-L-alanine amidase [Amycolatopsis rhabdoformis]|uniref:N-acetylmuramoyl-L-alanine amidase n=1 Tax=Amycolatopsis rhabdoformis TaxID=1448059 RepID=A0ABZ1I0I3_9PSEU|nr:N-acetylmuramoyl-L-alanine amidase [Amycolatopsis rhabdoformis]WSE27884.1 N-acetylmuramoyl-L-alanine amidase [Amycolatopsis rhabdoformis]